MLKNLDIEIKVNRHVQLLIISIIPILFLFFSILLGEASTTISGLYKIILASGVLLTDYLEVGGLAATLLNSSLITLINIFIIYKLKVRITGAVIAAVFTLAGFAFLGKSIFNIWPMYLGGYIYTRYKAIPYSNIIVVIMFSTCLAPIISQISFSSGLPLYIGIPLGGLVGTIIGFIITPLSSNMSKVHQGYNLYNVGFTGGIIGILIFSLMNSFGLEVERHSMISNDYDIFFRILLSACFLFLIIIGFIINNKSFKGYRKILDFEGKQVTDYTQLVGYGLTFINMGLVGLICIAFVYIAGGSINGPIVGGIITVAGFSAFGNHPKNSIPIMIGILFGGIIKIWDMKSTAAIIAGLFGTTLAPIAGKYGWLIGILAGFLHISAVMGTGNFHGGTNLYNNGFAGGLVASIMVPVLESFKKKR